MDECEEFGHHCGRCDGRDIKEYAWKNLSVTAIAAENLSVREYITQLEQERDRLRGALDLHVNDLQAEIAELQAALRELLGFTYFGYWRHSNEWIGRKRPESDEPLPTTNPTRWMPLPDPPKVEPEDPAMTTQIVCRHCGEPIEEVHNGGKTYWRHNGRGRFTTLGSKWCDPYNIASGYAEPFHVSKLTGDVRPSEDELEKAIDESGLV